MLSIISRRPLIKLPRISSVAVRATNSCCPKSKKEQPTSTSDSSPSATDRPFTLSFWTDAHSWRRAIANTTRCLVGCSLGDFSMMFYLQSQHPSLPTVITMSAAMLTGLATSLLLETVSLRVTEKWSWQRSARTAFNMSFISMLSMEAAQNLVDYHLTGGVCDFHSPAWWLALLPSLAAGFVTPLPYNYYQLRRYGKACH